ncbi:hypothetical protein [Lactococcus lactis]|uniref:hypothetical protein n=1 Tax=Lactococcus lactis TaxID=1358 RepID=UPI001F5619DE|nr:hypothetical protein [Lactococcus lactis]
MIFFPWFISSNEENSPYWIISQSSRKEDTAKFAFFSFGIVFVIFFIFYGFKSTDVVQENLYQALTLGDVNVWFSNGWRIGILACVSSLPICAVFSFLAWYGYRFKRYQSEIPYFRIDYEIDGQEQSDLAVNLMSDYSQVILEDGSQLLLQTIGTKVRIFEVEVVTDTEEEGVA